MMAIPKPRPGAIVCRVAPSFVRFGNFEILAAQNEPDTLKRLADFVIAEYFPELISHSGRSLLHHRLSRRRFMQTGSKKSAAVPAC